MKIAVAFDHRGAHNRDHLIGQLRHLGHEVLDFGTDSAKPCDYPDYAIPASLAVLQKHADRAILIDGSGIGMAIVANKIPGIRAATCHDELTAEVSRHYNDANVLCMAADLLGEELIRRIVKVWLLAEFEQGRHTRRIEKITALENRIFGDITKAMAQAANLLQHPADS